MSRLNSFLLCLCVFNLVNGHKILVYSPKLGKSHVMFIGKIADVLSKAGNEIVVLQPVIDEKVTISGVKYGRVIEKPKDFDISFDVDSIQEDVWSFEEQSFSQMTKIVSILRDLQAASCLSVINDKKLMNELKSENFTLSIGEPFDPCFYGIVEALEIDNYISAFPSSGLSNAFGSIFGLPSTPSFLPSLHFGHPPLSYLDRAKSLGAIIFISYWFPKNFINPLTEALKPALGENFDTMAKIGASNLVFVNADEHLDYPHVTSHKFINIGGLGMSKPKPLEKKYEEIMNSSKKGVVLVSFGSVAQSFKMPKVLKTKFLETFAQFPDITFLWKYEKDEDNIAVGYDNVITGNWLPQPDLLAHLKMLAFISHGGANSVMEAAYAGVPLIGIPLMADQFRNVIMAEYRKIATVVHKKELLDGKLADAIKKITHDDSYNYHVKRISAMIKSSPMNSDEKIVKYTDFVAKFGFKNNLDMYGRQLNFLQYYCLDIILPVFGIIFVILYVLYKVVKLGVRKFLNIFDGKSKIE